MGILKKICFCFILLQTGCKLGYTNEKNEYVPKRPNFTLKDKPKMVFPVKLDTINIYRLEKYYFRGKEESLFQNKEMGILYIKFYPNGRCCSFMISRLDEFSLSNKLKPEDLNTNNGRNGKDYYYSEDGKTIQTESFVYGEGFGMYVKFNFFLNEDGDTLNEIDETTKYVYVKEIIPPTWEKYPVNW